MRDFITGWAVIVLMVTMGFIVSLATPSEALQALFIMVLFIGCPIGIFLDATVFNQKVSDHVCDMLL